jgi:hypothetical protein
VALTCHRYSQLPCSDCLAELMRDRGELAALLRKGADKTQAVASKTSPGICEHRLPAPADESHRPRALLVGTSVGSDEPVTDSSSHSRENCREE